MQHILYNKFLITWNHKLYTSISANVSKKVKIVKNYYKIKTDLKITFDQLNPNTDSSASKWWQTPCLYSSN